jgi:hypothetical protein
LIKEEQADEIVATCASLMNVGSKPLMVVCDD